MKNNVRLSVFSICLYFLTSSICFSASLVNDWSNFHDPNEDWSYNQGNTQLPFNIPNWPQGEFGSTQTAWANGDSAGTQIPAWLKMVAYPQEGSLYTYDYLLGDVLVHSTYGDEAPANVTWLNPTSGFYDIDGVLWAARRNHKINDWSLYQDDVLLDSGKIAYDDNYFRVSPDVIKIQNRYISAGSVLRLQVHGNLLSDPGGDFVGVDLNITPIAAPEPISSILFLTGGGLMLFRNKLNIRF